MSETAWGRQERFVLEEYITHSSISVCNGAETLRPGVVDHDGGGS